MHCDVVRDLLPLYVDDVCSEKSKEEIEEHLNECEECKEIALAMRADISMINMEENLNEAENLKRISRQWKHDRQKYTLVGMTVAITILVILFIASLFIGVQWMPAV